MRQKKGGGGRDQGRQSCSTWQAHELHEKKSIGMYAYIEEKEEEEEEEEGWLGEMERVGRM